MGAAAFAGIVKSSDSDTGPLPPNLDIIQFPDRLVVYPTGDPLKDYPNLQGAISGYPQYIVSLMDRSRGGQMTAFMLPEGEMVWVTRDVDVVGNKAVIQGGDVAFYCADNHSFGLKGVTLRYQSTAGVLGNFNNVDLVSSGVEPIPVPEPAHGFVLRLTGMLTVINTTVMNSRVGLYAEGMVGGQVTASTIFAGVCGAFLNGANTRISGSSFYLGGGEEGISDVLLAGLSETLMGNRYVGGTNIVIASSASDSAVHIGRGSVASGVEPIPVPEPKIVDMGLNSVLRGRYTPAAAPPGLQNRIDALYEEMFGLLYVGGEGGGDLG